MGGSGYLQEEARDILDCYGLRWFPTLGICVFDHKASYVVADGNTVCIPLRGDVDSTPYLQVDGHGRRTSREGREEQDDEKKQGEHDAGGLQESAPGNREMEVDSGDLHQNRRRLYEGIDLGEVIVQE